MFVNEPIRGQPASAHSGVAPCVRVRGKLDASPARLRLSAQLTANYKLESGPCVCVSVSEAFITVLTTLPRPAGLLEVKFIPFFKSVSRLSR